LDDVVGRALLRLAAVLHRKVAGDDAQGRWLARRDRAIRAAHRRGVSVEALAAGMRLTPSWIRQVLRGKKPPQRQAMDEAA
jgi:Mor family transcriptional regulator